MQEWERISRGLEAKWAFAVIARDEAADVHRDQDSVHTNYDWVTTLVIDHEARASDPETGANGKPWVESMGGRIKTEIGFLITEARDPAKLEEIVRRHMNCYDNARRHSSIGYQTLASISNTICTDRMSQPISPN